MGYIANLNKASPSKKVDFPGMRGGQVIWRQVFGTSKEDAYKPNQQSIASGGNYANTATGTEASVKRLLEALRSRAPGGWSDNRWEQQRHFVGIAYVAIHRQNELFTQAEFQVFVEDAQHPDGKRPVTPDDPPQGDRVVKPYDLVNLLKKPNPEDSFGDLMANWNLNMDTTGMGLTWMVPNRLGVPFELYSIPTSIAIPQPAINPEYPHGYYRIQPVYPYGPFSSHPTPASAVGAPIPAEWMLRFKYPHPFLRYEGYSPMTALRLHLDEVESIDRSRFFAMKRALRPNAVLQMEDSDGMQPLPEPEIDRIRAEIESAFQGPENAGNLFVCAPGSRLEEFGTRPIDMDYQAGWEQLVGFVLGGYGITKPAAGMIEDSSYSTLFATLKQLYWLTLEPKADRIASKLTRHLGPYFGDNLIVEVRCKRIDDHEVRFAKIDKAMAALAITKNEVRKELEMPLTEQPWGDEIATIPSPPPPQPMMVGPGGAPLPGAVGDPGMMQDPNAPPLQATANGAEADIQNAIGVLNSFGLIDEEHEEDNTENHRPRPGSMGRGSLGPRKYLEWRARKQVNGHI